jgi:hypothetical protein
MLEVMKPKGKAVQLAMHCRCGRESILAHGMCSTCHTLRRQDEEYFGGLREAVLERDGCRSGSASRLEQGSAASSSITALRDDRS